jgi:Pyridoxamine 5'-phosphate oxidase
MGREYEAIDPPLRAFIEAQHVFFVATAPSGDTGHVNLSPKGLTSLRVLGPRTVAYLDYVGSGAETIAHLRQNGRIVIMLCAFEGPPKIVRLHGRGEVVEPGDPQHGGLRGLFPAVPLARSVIRVSVTRIADSCGYGVPLYAYEGDRSQLVAWADHKGAEGLELYQAENNARSIDDLAALRWLDQPKKEEP